MEPTSLITDFILITFLAGVFATGAMLIVMGHINRLGLANADMIRALGSLLTRSMESSAVVGLLIHFTAGTIFSGLYILALQKVMWTGIPLALIGGVMGFIHGFIVSFLLVSTIAEHHPLPQFRKAGLPVGAAHLVGHVAFGGVVGLVISLSNYQIPSSDEYVAQMIKQSPKYAPSSPGLEASDFVRASYLIQNVSE